MFSLSIYLLLIAAYSHGQNTCLSRDYNRGGTVCVCNAEHCDTLPTPEPLEESQFYIYTSNKAGLRFNLETGVFTESNASTNQIRIDPQTKYQTIFGFGGAFTDATGINILSLDEDVQEKLLRSYFSEDGIEYSMCRVPIGGTDFSTHGYSYDDGDVDIELNNFALADEDHQYKIPLIKQATELSNNNLDLFASAWTAPTWMKTNGEYAGLGYLKDEMYQAWADYFVKFLDSYKQQGIEFWGMTTGNEPHTAFIPDIKINSVGWNDTDMGTWILNNLGPAIRGSSHSDIKLMILDDQRNYLPSFVDIALEDDATKDYIDGIAVHWYVDNVLGPEPLQETHDHFEDKFILSTEACTGFEADAEAVVLGSWERGERYSADIIEDLLNWVSGWVDWNMALDLTGGPTYIDNFVDSPIIVNATAGEFYKQPMYYHLGHFSKFVSKGSSRIDSSVDVGESVAVAAFQRPDNGIAVVILNTGNEVVLINLVDGTRGTAQVELSERSITTILYR